MDTTTGGFRDEFGNYFDVPSNVVPHSMPAELWDVVTKHPSTLAGLPITYRTETMINTAGRRIRAVSGTDVALEFDFGSVYQEDCLVHHTARGGRISHNAWEWLRLESGLRHDISTQVSSLGEYDAVHIRNTDYRTDYRELFESLDRRLGKRIVLCTDDPECRQYAAERFGTRLIPTEYVDNSRSVPLYNQRLDSGTVRAANVATLTDLFLLAGSCRYYYGRVSLRGGPLRNSGYSVLAGYLHSRKDLVGAILEGKRLAAAW